MPALLASAENTTASPELEVAATVYAAPPTVAAAGADEVNVIAWTLRTGALLIANDCCARGAAAKLPFPAWSASTVQVPEPTSETEVPETVQMPALLGSAENATTSPDVAV